MDNFDDDKEHEQALMESARQGPNVGGFFNLNRFVDTNRETGQRASSVAAEKVRQTGDQVRADIYGAKAQFQRGAQAGALTQSPYEYAKGAYRTPGTMGGTLTSAQAKELSGRTYSGPKGLTEDPNLGKRAGDAADLAKDVGSTSGLMSRARQLYGSGAGYYGATSQGMDAFLAQTHGGGELAEVQKEFGGLEDLFNVENQAAGDLVGQLTAETAANAKKFGELVPGLETSEKEAAARAAEDERTRAIEQSRRDAAAKQRDLTASGNRDRLRNNERVKVLSDEQYAAKNGVSYDEWVAGGRPQSSAEWAAFWQKFKRPAVDAGNPV